MSIKRILTGIRPTGALHIGHYVGALKQWISLQEDYECFFLIADVQALTTHIDHPELIEKSVREVMLDFIGIGLDPTRENVHFVLQSGVPELTELTTYFSMLIPFSEVERNPTVKAEKTQLKSNPTAGFMIYPISQAADILLFTPYPQKQGNQLLVPVGEDQIPHLEQTNRIARAFNRRYGQIFLECISKVGKVGRLVGTDGGTKMSKSLGNVILLKDEAEMVEKTVRRMFTDPTKIHKSDQGHPKKCPVYLYHRVFGDKETLNERAEKCKSGKLGCVECKKDLAKILIDFLEPIRERREKAEEAPLRKYLNQGTEKAREIGKITMEAVRKAMHLKYSSIS